MSLLRTNCGLCVGAWWYVFVEKLTAYLSRAVPPPSPTQDCPCRRSPTPRAMHLMYYTNEEGHRVYTLKVPPFPAAAEQCNSAARGAAPAKLAQASVSRLMRTLVRCAEGGSGRQADGIRAPRPLLAR